MSENMLSLIHALRICARISPCPPYCPYYSKLGDGEECARRLMETAAAALQAKEPHVMTLYEFNNLCETDTPVWLEWRGSPLEPVREIHRYVDLFKASRYGECGRLWVGSKPTTEQVANTLWGGRK